MAKIATNSIVDAKTSAELSMQSNQLGRAKTLANRELKTDKEVEKAASGFEALLLHQMLKSMWATVEQTGLLGENSNQSQIYRDMLNQAIADSVADGPGIGVKDFMKTELLKAQKGTKG